MQIEAFALLAHAIGINHGRLHRAVDGRVREPALDRPVDAAPAHRPAHDRLRHQHAAGDGDGCGGGPEKERCVEEGLELERGGGDGGEEGEEGEEGGDVHFLVDWGWVFGGGKGREGRDFIAGFFFLSTTVFDPVYGHYLCRWADHGNF